MGMFKDIRTLKKQAKEIQKDWDPGAQMRSGMERMQAAQAAMAQQTSALHLGVNGEQAEARVLAARDTGTQLNMQPMFEIDLLVTRAGQPPYPVTVTQMVPLASVGRVTPGTTLQAQVDPTNPTAVALFI